MPVVIDGRTAAIGAVGFGHGAVYIYNLFGTNWTFTQKITDPITNDFETFGDSLALKDDVLLIGQRNPFASLNFSGQVYVYRRAGTNWFLEQTLLDPSPATTNELFGMVEAISGQTIVIGNAMDSSVVRGNGAITIYQRTGGNWMFQTKIIPDDAVPSQWFGNAVAVDGNTTIVGAPSAFGAPSVYVYVRTGTNWSLQQKILPPDPYAETDFFGGVVALEGNTAVVGGAGSVSIYVRNGETWTLQQKLTPAVSTNGVGSRFGSSVSIDHGLIAIGVPDETVNGKRDAGAVKVYRFNGTNWECFQQLTASDPIEGVTFGLFSDIDADTGVISGSLYDSQAAPSAGAAYIFSREHSSHIGRQQPRVNFPLHRQVHRMIAGDSTPLLRAEPSGNSRQGRIYQRRSNVRMR